MGNTIIATGLWKTITATCKDTHQRSFVAVAYFGQGGAALLPLNKGSILVVDASETTVKCGQTSPKELLKLYNRGVNIFSVKNLHAKVYVIGTKAFIGSANVSAHSAGTLKEAAFFTSSRPIVSQAKEYVIDLADFELGEERLKQLAKIYKPSKFRAGKKTSPVNVTGGFYLYRIDTNDYPTDSKTAYLAGQEVAKTRRKDKRNILDDYLSSNMPGIKRGDIVIQLLKENGKEYLYPPATVLNVKKWNDKHHFVYLELPNQRRRSLEIVKTLVNPKILKRSGRKSYEQIQELAKLWNPKK